MGSRESVSIPDTLDGGVHAAQAGGGAIHVFGISRLIETLHPAVILGVERAQVRSGVGVHHRRAL